MRRIVTCFLSSETASKVVSLMMVLSGTFFMLPSIQTKAWTATALNLVSILLGVVLYVGIKGRNCLLVMISVAATAAYDAFGAGYTVFKLAEMDKRGLDVKVATDFACYVLYLYFIAVVFIYLRELWEEEALARGGSNVESPSLNRYPVADFGALADEGGGANYYSGYQQHSTVPNSVADSSAVDPHDSVSVVQGTAAGRDELKGDPDVGTGEADEDKYYG